MGHPFYANTSFQVTLFHLSVDNCFQDIWSQMMPCPFLGRLPSSYVRNYGLNLLKSFGSHCPVVSRLATSLTSDPCAEQSLDSPTLRCPFLADVSSPVVKEASQELQGDVIQFPPKTESGELHFLCAYSWINSKLAADLLPILNKPFKSQTSYWLYYL